MGSGSPAPLPAISQACLLVLITNSAHKQPRVTCSQNLGCGWAHTLLLPTMSRQQWTVGPDGSATPCRVISLMLTFL